MRTLLTGLLLLLLSSCHAQADNSSKTVHSFTGKWYLLGESPYPIYKTSLLQINRKEIKLTSGSKTSLWPIKFLSESSDGNVITDSYESYSEKGIPTIVKMIYEDSLLTDVAFLQGVLSYHFFITYAKSL